VPLSTRTAVTLGMISLTAIGVATVFGNTILALVAPPAEVSTGGPGPHPVDTARSGPATPAPAARPSAGAKDASS